MIELTITVAIPETRNHLTKYSVDPIKLITFKIHANLHLVKSRLPPAVDRIIEILNRMDKKRISLMQGMIAFS